MATETWMAEVNVRVSVIGLYNNRFVFLLQRLKAIQGYVSFVDGSQKICLIDAECLNIFVFK